MKSMNELGIINIPMVDARAERLEKNGEFGHECIVCGKPTNETLWISTVEGPDAIYSNVSEEDLADHGLYSQGAFPIGIVCAKKFPKGYVYSKNYYFKKQ